MEKDYIEILAALPNMDLKKFRVRNDSWEHFCDHHLNLPEPGNCFLPCIDENGEAMFLDMTKIIYFYVLPNISKKKPTAPKKLTK